MEIYKGLVFEEFVADDVDILAPIMKRAFDEDIRRHLNIPEGGPTGYDNGDFLREYALHKDSQAFKISKDGQPLGAIILWISDSRVNYLGNIFIDPEFQDKGIGLKIWRFIENKYPETKVWRTETPSFSRRNHNFYVNKCGFKIVKINGVKNEEFSFYQFEKEMA